MSDQENRPPHDPVPWDHVIRQVLAVSGTQIADVLAPGCKVDTLKADLIKQTDRALCVRLRCESKTAFFKKFLGPDSQQVELFDRERMMLAGLRGSGLVPVLYAISGPQRWVMLQDVPQDAGAAADRLAPIEFGMKVGEWLARFEAVAPYDRATGNWLTYFGKLGLKDYLPEIEKASETLSEIPLCGVVMSRNDAALHNYLLDDNGHLLGCDFAGASMRPRGWDYVMAWQALLQRYGDDGVEAIEGLSAGFSDAYRGGLMIDELNTVARILFCAQFLAAQSDKQRAA